MGADDLAGFQLNLNGDVSSVILLIDIKDAGFWTSHVLEPPL
jgi:hypothetical protein